MDKNERTYLFREITNYLRINFQSTTYSPSKSKWVLQMKSWKYSDWRVRPHTLYFSLIRCLSGQYFDSGILFISSGQLGTRGERNKGCGGEPFNLNIFNFSFLGPIYSYLGYTKSTVLLGTNFSTGYGYFHQHGVRGVRSTTGTKVRMSIPD